MSETDERQSASVAAPPSAWRDFAGCPVVGAYLALATSWIFFDRPLIWLVGLCAALASVIGLYAVAAG